MNLNDDTISIKNSLRGVNDMDKYFDIHVKYGKKDGDGYSIPIIASNKDEAVFLAKISNRFQYEDDVDFIDYIEEISESDYCMMEGV